MNFIDVYKYCPCCGSDKFILVKDNAKKCQNCGYEYYMNPPAAVALIAFDKDGRMLAVRRAKDPFKGKLDLPGGFVDVGESAEEALKRELMEELNIEVELDDYLFSIPNNYVYRGIDSHPLDLYFKGRIKSKNTLKLNDDENSEILFIEPKNLSLDDFGLKSNKIALNRLFFEKS